MKEEEEEEEADVGMVPYLSFKSTCNIALLHLGLSLGQCASRE